MHSDGEICGMLRSFCEHQGYFSIKKNKFIKIYNSSFVANLNYNDGLLDKEFHNVINKCTALFLQDLNI